MARRERNNYFKLLTELLGYSKESIVFLGEVLADFNPDENILKAQMVKMHDIEHEADQKRHELMEKLAKEFVTPIEREDIVEIASAIDTITDSIEDILQRMYMHHIKVINPEALIFVDIIEQCVDILLKIYGEFEHHRKSATIHNDVIALNALEQVGDDIYMRATRELYNDLTDPMDIRKWSITFERMEICCDACETAGNLVEVVIMKNS